MRAVVTGFLILVFSVQSQAADLTTSAGVVRIDRIATGLKEPWGLAFLPDGSFLVTERKGRLYRILEDGSKARVSGVPKVVAKGQGGLLDIVVAKDFERTREIFLTYAKSLNGGAGTALAVARVSKDFGRLENLRVLFQMSAGSKGGRHFGSRVVEAADGTLFLTVGERGEREKAQDPNLHNGKTIHINRNGSAPASNPYAGSNTGLPEIWSLGHRNAQGAAFDENGRLWLVEHGAKGGDEINLVRKGVNYGWPIISYGTHYNGKKIGVGTQKEGYAQPAYYWDPSIAPSGMMIYSGKLWPKWKGDIFVGSLKFDHIALLDRAGTRASKGETLQNTDTKRVRDIREAPDGSIWFLSAEKGAVFRLSPK